MSQAVTYNVLVQISSFTYVFLCYLQPNRLKQYSVNSLMMWPQGFIQKARNYNASTTLKLFWPSTNCEMELYCMVVEIKLWPVPKRGGWVQYVLTTWLDQPLQACILQITQIEPLSCGHGLLKELRTPIWMQGCRIAFDEKIKWTDHVHMKLWGKHHLPVG